MFKYYLHVILCIIYAGNSETLKRYCNLPSDEGICRGYFRRYFYNVTSEECEVFYYGGCLGNRNRFSTIEKCWWYCKGQNYSAVTTTQATEETTTTTTKPLSMTAKFLLGITNFGNQVKRLFKRKKEEN
ncbi:Tissue factor pathway inhibitor [Schistosoma japonicum]|nr:Tissue factor pathway inhibitor [Schistosoma japonicum]